MKKGFTLIELLAVIVILAIIALIATPMILNVVEKSRKGAAESSALGYIDAVEKQMMINLLDSDTTNDMTDGVYETSNLEVSVKGEKPSEGWVQIGKGKVVNYSLKIGNYYVNPKDGNPSIALANKNGEIATKPEGSVIPTIASCPGCVYAYTTENWYYSGTPTILTSEQYKENYEDIGKNYFLGMKLNSSGTIEKAYACGIKDGETFCIEGTMDGSAYNANKTLLQSERLYNNGCEDLDSEIDCYDSSLNAYARRDDGYAGVELGGSHGCAIYNGSLRCL